MKTSTLLGVLRGFRLFRSFVRAIGFYQTLLALAFVVLIALLFNNLSLTFQDVTLIVTEADEELVAMLSTFVNDALWWLFLLVCIYTLCTILLSVQGARYLQQQAKTASTVPTQVAETES